MADVVARFNLTVVVAVGFIALAGWRRKPAWSCPSLDHPCAS